MRPLLLVSALLALLLAHHASAFAPPSWAWPSRLESRASQRTETSTLENTCQCDCCYSLGGTPGRTECVPPIDTSFDVTTCSNCDVDACSVAFPIACAQSSSIVNADCIARKGWMLRLVPVFFIAASVLLLGYGFCFKRYDGYHDDRATLGRPPLAEVLPSLTTFVAFPQSYGAAARPAAYDTDRQGLLTRPSRPLAPISETAEVTGPTEPHDVIPDLYAPLAVKPAPVDRVATRVADNVEEVHEQVVDQQQEDKDSAEVSAILPVLASGVAVVSAAATAAAVAAVAVVSAPPGATDDDAVAKLGAKSDADMEPSHIATSGATATAPDAGSETVTTVTDGTTDSVEEATKTGDAVVGSEPGAEAVAAAPEKEGEAQTEAEIPEATIGLKLPEMAMRISMPLNEQGSVEASAEEEKAGETSAMKDTASEEVAPAAESAPGTENVDSEAIPAPPPSSDAPMKTSGAPDIIVGHPESDETLTDIKNDTAPHVAEAVTSTDSAIAPLSEAVIEFAGDDTGAVAASDANTSTGIASDVQQEIVDASDAVISRKTVAVEVEEEPRVDVVPLSEAVIEFAGDGTGAVAASDANASTGIASDVQQEIVDASDAVISRETVAPEVEEVPPVDDVVIPEANTIEESTENVADAPAEPALPSEASVAENAAISSEAPEAPLESSTTEVLGVERDVVGTVSLAIPQDAVDSSPEEPVSVSEEVAPPHSITSKPGTSQDNETADDTGFVSQSVETPDFVDEPDGDVIPAESRTAPDDTEAVAQHEISATITTATASASTTGEDSAPQVNVDTLERVIVETSQTTRSEDVEVSEPEAREDTVASVDEAGREEIAEMGEQKDDSGIGRSLFEGGTSVEAANETSAEQSARSLLAEDPRDLPPATDLTEELGRSVLMGGDEGVGNATMEELLQKEEDTPGSSDVLAALAALDAATENMMAVVEGSGLALDDAFKRNADTFGVADVPVGHASVETAPAEEYVGTADTAHIQDDKQRVGDASYLPGDATSYEPSSVEAEASGSVDNATDRDVPAVSEDAADLERVAHLEVTEKHTDRAIDSLVAVEDFGGVTESDVKPPGNRLLTYAQSPTKAGEPEEGAEPTEDTGNIEVSGAAETSGDTDEMNPEFLSAVDEAEVTQSVQEVAQPESVPLEPKNEGPGQEPDSWDERAPLDTASILEETNNVSSQMDHTGSDPVSHAKEALGEVSQDAPEVLEVDAVASAGPAGEDGVVAINDEAPKPTAIPTLADAVSAAAPVQDTVDIGITKEDSAFTEAPTNPPSHDNATVQVESDELAGIGAIDDSVVEASGDRKFPEEALGLATTEGSSQPADVGADDSDARASEGTNVSEEASAQIGGVENSQMEDAVGEGVNIHVGVAEPAVEAPGQMETEENYFQKEDGVGAAAEDQPSSFEAPDQSGMEESIMSDELVGAADESDAGATVGSSVPEPVTGLTSEELSYQAEVLPADNDDAAHVTGTEDHVQIKTRAGSADANQDEETKGPNVPVEPVCQKGVAETSQTQDLVEAEDINDGEAVEDPIPGETSGDTGMGENLLTDVRVTAARKQFESSEDPTTREEGTSLTSEASRPAEAGIGGSAQLGWYQAGVAESFRTEELVEANNEKAGETAEDSIAGEAASDTGVGDLLTKVTDAAEDKKAESTEDPTIRVEATGLISETSRLAEAEIGGSAQLGWYQAGVVEPSQTEELVEADNNKAGDTVEDPITGETSSDTGVGENLLTEVTDAAAEDKLAESTDPTVQEEDTGLTPETTPPAEDVGATNNDGVEIDPSVTVDASSRTDLEVDQTEDSALGVDKNETGAGASTTVVEGIPGLTAVEETSQSEGVDAADTIHTDVGQGSNILVEVPGENEQAGASHTEGMVAANNGADDTEGRLVTDEDTGLAAAKESSQIEDVTVVPTPEESLVRGSEGA